MLPRLQAAPLAASLLFVMCGGILRAQATETNAQPQVMQWRSGLTEISGGWAEHDGDNAAWAKPDFDDSAWAPVDVEDMGAATAGWRWFRKRVVVGSDHPNVRLLISGGEGTYELFVNGARVDGPHIGTALAVRRPTERVFQLHDDGGDFHLALRTNAPTPYATYSLPLFLSVTMGSRVVIEYERQALESDRLYSAIPSIAINLLLVLEGLGALALFASQRGERDYLFLSLFLLLQGVSEGLWHVQQAGIAPVAANFLLADPLVYFLSIAQIEFTFNFARRRLGRVWRTYEIILLLPLVLIPALWLGHFSFDAYTLIQAIVTAPMIFLLPAFLFAWYRRGNREAGLLIFPSLLPAASGVLYNLGLISAYMGWTRFDFLIEPIPLGPVSIPISDAANLMFLLAIGIVMFFRFTRVSREQARTAAELDAAREIQRRLVPESLPAVAGLRIEAAYIPANEVGGDFYQVLELGPGAALIVVGDVSGKGLKAAMKGALTIGALRALASDVPGPAELLARLNRQLAQDQDGGFVTCLCARIGADGTFTAANAGHLPPYRNGEELDLDAGLPLGITLDAEYCESECRLEPGDLLTLLSDGVVEARNAAGELFGFERTSAIAQQTAERVASAAQAFGQEDDITVLTVTLAGGPLARAADGAAVYRS